MKITRAVSFALVFGAVLGVSLFGLRVWSGRSGASSPKVEAATGADLPATPADQRLRAADSQVRLRPDAPGGYNLRAAAYMQKARETGDFGLNAKAEEALRKSLAVAPDNYDALKLRAKILLTFHHFEEALAAARRAQSLRPDDHDVYGALTDAYVELGDYERAVEAAQRMVDLRPDAASYSRVAYLRSLHGDAEGAVEAMRVAVKASDPRDPEAVAWARVQLGEELAKAGRAEEAAREYEAALRVLPGYEAALQAQARARAASGDYEGAVEIYRQVSSHDAKLALGDLYARLGRAEEARRMYEAFERDEREAAAAENDLGHLARFWADRGTNLDEALRIARDERARRADVFTCDALAWVLFRKGRLAEARAAAGEALRLGTRDPLINFHAGMIYGALGERRRAAKHLRLALEMKAALGVAEADEAARALESLGS